MTSLIGHNVVTAYPEKFPRAIIYYILYYYILLYIPAKYEKSAPYSIGVIGKTKCGAGVAGRAAGSGGLASPIYKQAFEKKVTKIWVCVQ